MKMYTIILRIKWAYFERKTRYCNQFCVLCHNFWTREARAILSTFSRPFVKNDFFVFQKVKGALTCHFRYVMYEWYRLFFGQFFSVFWHETCLSNFSVTRQILAILIKQFHWNYSRWTGLFIYWVHLTYATRF